VGREADLRWSTFFGAYPRSARQPFPVMAHGSFGGVGEDLGERAGAEPAGRWGRTAASKGGAGSLGAHGRAGVETKRSRVNGLYLGTVTGESVDRVRRGGDGERALARPWESSYRAAGRGAARVSAISPRRSSVPAPSVFSSASSWPSPHSTGQTPGRQRRPVASADGYLPGMSDAIMLLRARELREEST